MDKQVQLLDVSEIFNQNVGPCKRLGVAGPDWEYDGITEAENQFLNH